MNRPTRRHRHFQRFICVIIGRSVAGQAYVPTSHYVEALCS